MRRVRRGRGFAYTDANGERVLDVATLARISQLTIPPAWREVWICADPYGHLQATGIDAAGRKQYLYHPAWRIRRDREKFRRMMRFGAALPFLRRQVAHDLVGSELTRTRMLACAARLLDLGLFRIGSEQYADEDGGIGLATVSREHVAFRDGGVVFDYPAKSGVRRLHRIDDPVCMELIRELKRRRSSETSLLAYRDGRRWIPVRSDDINDYLKAHMGEEFSAKDFRTWNATVLAAIVLAADGQNAHTAAARTRAINGAIRRVAEALGNTPAVARRAYIDPHIVDRYLSDWSILPALPRRIEQASTNPRIRRRIERAVIDLLHDERDSPGVTRRSK